jgi:hypothetical protein
MPEMQYLRQNSMDKLITKLGCVLSAYRDFFSRYSDDPDDAARLFFALVVVAGLNIVVSLSGLLLGSTEVQLNLYVSLGVYVLLAVGLLAVKLPEPKRNRPIVVLSWIILTSSLFVLPMIKLMIEN